MNSDSTKPMKLSPMQRLMLASPKTVRRAWLISLFFSAALAHSGCQHIGPQSIVDDRLAYNKAVVTSWEQQALLNIVRARYDDLVGFVDVGPVLQTHSLQGTTTANFGASILPWNAVMNTLMPGLMGSRQTTDSPNITYTPLAGSEFAKNLTTPLQPSDIFGYLIESGYKADVIMPLTLYSVNEIQSTNGEVPDVKLNSKITSTSRGIRNPEFKLLAAAVECAHSYGDLSFASQAAPGSDATKKIFMIIADKDSEHTFKNQHCKDQPVAFIREKLHLKAAETKFEIVAEPHPTKDTEIAVRTRSVIAAIRWLSRYVQVPPPHFEERLAQKANLNESEPPLMVDYALKKPPTPFVAIPYQGYWFSICQADRNSKFSLIYLRTLLALADTGARPTAPVFTIPTR